MPARLVTKAWNQRRISIPKTSLQNFPDHQYPSIIGRPILRTEEQAIEGVVLKDIMCGDEAAKARSMLQITYPVRQAYCLHGIPLADACE